MLTLLPYSWSPIRSLSPGDPFTTVQCFCVDNSGKRYYLRIKCGKSVTLHLQDSIVGDSEVIDHMIDEYSPDDIKVSLFNDKVLWMRNPTDLDLRKGDTRIDMRHPTSVIPDILPCTTCMSKDLIYDPIVWDASSINQYGDLTSFFDARGIRPYSWFKVNKYSQIEYPYTSAAVEIEANEDDIDPIPVSNLSYSNKNILLFDIEVAGTPGTFVDASNPKDSIVSVSLITVSEGSIQGYTIISKDVNIDLVKKSNIPHKIIITENESELIISFFRIWMSSSPDRVCHWNGDKFAIPYLISRCKMLDIVIPPLSKIRGMNTPSTRAMINTPFGPDDVFTLLCPGVEFIDMMSVLTKLTPGETNYKLETIAQSLLLTGKSGMTIETMFEIISNGDRDRMAEVVWYSFKDVILLHDIWIESNMDSLIDDSCNSLGITSEELTRLSLTDISLRVQAYADPMFSLIGITNRLMKHVETIDDSHLLSPRPGFYSGLRLYHYNKVITSILRDEMTRNERLSDYINFIYEAIKNLPSTIQMSVIKSNPQLSSLIVPRIKAFISTITNIVLIDDEYIYTTKDSNAYSVLGPSVKTYGLIFYPSSKSHIEYIHPGLIVRKGTHKLVRPSFPLIAKIIDEYMGEVYAGKDPRGKRWTSEQLSKGIKLDDLAYTVRVRKSSSYAKGSKSLQATISKTIESTGIRIGTWMIVKYLILKDSQVRIILPNMDTKDVETDTTLNLEKYASEINDSLSLMDNMLSG